jgi:hypothetical protein
MVKQTRHFSGERLSQALDFARVGPQNKNLLCQKASREQPRDDALGMFPQQQSC